MQRILIVLAALAPALQQAAPAAPGKDEARELWTRVCAASGEAQRPPLISFQLKADVLTRSGVQTNEAHIDYRYLAPDCIRFVLPSKNETGRFGPAPGVPDAASRMRRAAAGRGTREDRKKVDDMLTLARNYGALFARLNLLARAATGRAWPSARPCRARRSCAGWRSRPRLSCKATSRSGWGRVSRRGHLRDDLPGGGIIRERGKSMIDPLLVEFSQYQAQDGFKLPFQLRVHALDRSHSPAVFAKDAAQEVYVTAAALRPSQTVEDFKPRKGN
jgi:hypothetical protein